LVLLYKNCLKRTEKNNGYLFEKFYEATCTLYIQNAEGVDFKLGGTHY